MLKVLGARDDVNLEEDSRGSSYCFVVVTSQSNNYLHSLKWINIFQNFLAETKHVSTANA